MTIDPALELLLRLSLALLFASAALHKLRAPRGFRDALAGYRLLPAPLLAPAALALVLAELGTAAGLLGVAGRDAGPLAGIALLGLYSGALAINLARGRTHIDCGCSGPAARRPVSWTLVARNLLLGAALCACLFAPGPRALIWLDAFTVGFGACLLALLYSASGRLLAAAPALALLRRTA